MKTKRTREAKRLPLRSAITAALLALLLAASGGLILRSRQADAAEDPHAGHAHDAAPVDPHAGHADDMAAVEPHAGDDEGIVLTPQQRERFGIVVRAAGPGGLRNEVRLPGEVVFNEDRIAHVVPRVPGIATDVRKTLGDRVQAGELLAIIDSADLATAKLDYIAAVTEVGCCQFDLPRAQAIHDNTLKMLELLEQSPSIGQLRESVQGEMGNYRSILISAYAEYVRARKEYERERTLVAQEISSKGDFLSAESTFKKAEAAYWGARDSAEFEVKQNLREMTRTSQLAALQAVAAEQKLSMIGLSEAEISLLATEAQSPGGPVEVDGHECTDPNCTECAARQAQGAGLNVPAAGEHADGHVCTDPNCTDCAAHETGAAGQDVHVAGKHADGHECTDPNCTDCAAHETGEAGHDVHAAGEHADGHDCTDPSCTDCAAHQPEAADREVPASPSDQAPFGIYAIRVPFDGLIVEKHIALGERVAEDSDVFMVVDTDTVWVNLTVYMKDLSAVSKGQEVILRADHSSAQARGVVAMLTPFVDESTQSATARVVLDNEDGRWRPGTFVTGFISTSEDNLPVVVPRNAIQNVEGRDVVFVEHEGEFEMVSVTLGRTDRSNAEVVAGLEPGTRYAAEGAYQLKATVITANLDSHAGHGH